MADRVEIAEKNFAGRELKRLALGRCLLERGRRERVGATLRNTGWTDEARAASLAVRRAKVAEREAYERRVSELYHEQLRRRGWLFVEAWFPRGADGVIEDPHYGVATDEAPYGYVDGTREPRKEPLYTIHGKPIIPRQYSDWHPVGGLVGLYHRRAREARNAAWRERIRAAEEYWGPFGERRRRARGK